MNPCLKTRLVILSIVISVIGSLGRSSFADSDRPNILWITSEDNSPYLGCYGDRLAKTPNLDRLAEQGVRYRNAFANAPVCSVARTTLITGMYATTVGAQNHRSTVAIPKQFLLYPEYMRSAGYYCTNNSKTDYNLPNAQKVWDANGNKANYLARTPNQPFLAVFNLISSHESQIAPKDGKTQFRLSPDQVVLPPYHPDTAIIRRDWANYYDQMTLMDQQVGELITKLESDGLSDDTIVFYYSDHGGGLPRGKRNIHDSGTHVPLIVRFPEKWSQLAPAKPGEWVDDLVNFVDFPVTLFSLCNVEIPEHYQGTPFLGAKKRSVPRERVFLYRGRMDERYDSVRAVRDSNFRYIRNYSPHRPYGQQYSYPFQVVPSMKSWHDEFIAGRCNSDQSTYWQPKSAEEFYAVSDDPFELRNLIMNSNQAPSIARLRSALRDEILGSRDTGFIPEGMISKLADAKTIYEYAGSDSYPLERILDTANIASDGDAKNLPFLIAALDDVHPVVRYWAATGCLILKGQNAPAKAKLKESIRDEWADVRTIAAEAIGQLGETEAAIATLKDVLNSGNQYEQLAALNSLDTLRSEAVIPLSVAQDLVRGLKLTEPADRIGLAISRSSVSPRR